MGALKQRILANIDADALLYVTTGKPMPSRDARWDEAVAQAIAKHQAEYLPLAEKIIEDKYRDLHSKVKSNLSYDEWIAIAKSFYTIDSDFTVTSTARNIDKEMTWECSSYLEACEKVQQLITYKYYDHFNKGHQFRYIPSDK